MDDLPLTRKLPKAFESKGAESIMAGLAILLPTLLCPFVLRIFERHDFTFPNLVNLLCFALGWLVFLFIGMTSITTGLSNRKSEKDWLKQSIRVDVKIVKREENVRYEDDYNKYGPFWYVHLSGEVFNNEKAVRADVKRAIYGKISEQETIYIYYAPEDPLIFLLEEEI